MVYWVMKSSARYMSNEGHTFLITHSLYPHCHIIEIMFLKHDFIVLIEIMFHSVNEVCNIVSV